MGTMMRISQSALDRSESLFSCFVECMWTIRGYHVDAFNRRNSNRDLFSETLRVLNVYAQDRTQAAYCLIVNGLVWDAEIVIRTVYEAFAKIALLSTSKVAEREVLLEEYWEVLSAIYDRQGAVKAEPAESLSRKFGTEGDARVFAMLRDARFYKVDPILDKRRRKEVEQRWSFSGIADSICKGDSRTSGLVGIAALRHGYGLSSHIVHADSRAMDLLEDRVRRGDDLIHLEVSHICRMLSDMVSLSSFSLHLSERSWSSADVMPEPLSAAFKSMSAAIEPFRTEFDSSQDEFYRSKGH